MGFARNIPLCGNVISVVCSPANERMGVTGGEPPSIDEPCFRLSPSPSPQAVGDAPVSKQASTFTRFGLWQGANSSPTPLVQGPQDSPLNMPARVRQRDFFTARRRYPGGASCGVGFGASLSSLTARHPSGLTMTVIHNFRELR